MVAEAKGSSPVEGGVAVGLDWEEVEGEVAGSCV